MGLNQGYIRLTNGYVKTLNVSERNRGWFYITKDKKGLELVQPQVTFQFNGEKNTFPVDQFGRALTGKDFISRLPDSFNVKWKNGVIVITE